MSEELPESAEPIVAVARAVKTRGLKGEIVAEVLTDFPDRFADVSQLIVVAPDGGRSRRCRSVPHQNGRARRVGPRETRAQPYQSICGGS